MATVLIPSSWAERKTRMAISPRFATRSLRNSAMGTPGASVVRPDQCGRDAGADEGRSGPVPGPAGYGQRRGPARRGVCARTTPKDTRFPPPCTRPGPTVAGGPRDRAESARSALGLDRVLQGADPFDGGTHDVARLEIGPGGRADPRRRPRRDDVARLEGHPPREERHHSRDREDHLCGVPVLLRVA